MGYVPQGLGLYGDLTVAENLAFVAQAYGAPIPDLEGRLAGQSDALVARLPLGMQREVSFAAALAHRPEVLVLDEPTSGLDALARADLWDTIREQADRGAGVLVTTHYMQEAVQCDRLLLLAQGRLVAEGSEADIVAGTTSLAVRTAHWADAFAVLDAAGEPVLLDGRSIRVAGGDPDRVARLLADGGLEATVTSVPGTIEERMLLLSRGAAA
jgi:ABC-2 type transport system ATP-binding protein/ribosome-dependent ATPase